MFGDRGIVEKCFEQRLVISLQREEIRWERIGREALKYSPGIRATIHVIAERNSHGAVYWIHFKIARNLNDHPIEQV